MIYCILSVWEQVAKNIST